MPSMSIIQASILEFTILQGLHAGLLTFEKQQGSCSMHCVLILELICFQIFPTSFRPVNWCFVASSSIKTVVTVTAFKKLTKIFTKHERGYTILYKYATDSL